jgi:tRNA nucleotidyltransferase (CCA-adding enzyme)
VADISPQVLAQRLEAHLTPEALFALHTLRKLTDAASLDLYLVGGAVRDLILQRDNVDLDLAIEADVAPIAEALAAATGARCVLHPRFGTSAITGRGFQLDLARTRRETYAHPGALPTVEPASIIEDMARRDFTINAMALQLTRAVDLIDPYEGARDSATGHISILHTNSFRDDATRMLRAFRYAGRLGFAVDVDTLPLLQRDLGYLQTITGPRLRRELLLFFDEPNAVEICDLAEGIGLLHAVHSAFFVHGHFVGRWQNAFGGPRLAPRDETGFCVLAASADDDGVTSLSARLHLTGRFENALRDAVRLRAGSSKLAAMRHDPVAAVETLEHAAPSAVWATGIVAGGATAETCETYLHEWRHVRPLLRGDDVIALGVQPGVAVGEALRVLRSAKLTGKATTRESEIALVRDLLQKTAG